MSDKQAGVAIRPPAGEGVSPVFMISAECWGPEGLRWADRFDPHNVVVNVGAEHLGNKYFGNATVSTAGPFLALHAAAVASNSAWNNISASQVASYGNNVPLISFATNAFGAGVRSASTSQSYSFNAGTQTVSGAAILWYTANTMSTNAASADVRMYAYGTFTNNSRAVQSNDTLNVSMTVSFGTA